MFLLVLIINIKLIKFYINFFKDFFKFKKQILK